MKKINLLIILFFIGLGSANAASLRIANASFVKVERYYQFRALLTKDDGSVVDVTKDTLWSSVGNRMRGAGEFLFPFPGFGSTSHFTTRIRASYNSEVASLTANLLVSVDASPDYIQIWGTTMTRSGGFANLRAQGYFGSKMIDLTTRGFWSALYGRISWGNYSAPNLRGRTSVNDSIRFSFGSRMSYHTIYVQN